MLISSVNVTTCTAGTLVNIVTSYSNSCKLFSIHEYFNIAVVEIVCLYDT